MRRREFLGVLGAAAAAWPVVARGQQPDRMRRVGVLTGLAADDAIAQARNAAFLQGLQQLGWTVGRNVRKQRNWRAIMGRISIGATVATVISISGAGINMSAAAEIKVISANGMREVIAETTAKFELASGHKLVVTVVETGEIRKRVLAGESYDVIMVPSDAADEFEKAGKIAPSSAVALIRVNFGLAAPSEGPRHDTSTPEGLKRTFLSARTVIITDPATGGISGVHLMEVLGKLGIADEMKSRLVPQPGGSFHAERVVKGEADLAVQAEHEIRCVKGATFLAYPGVFQRTTVFMGGIGAAAKDADAAKAYLAFMTGPEAATTYTAHCLTPGSNRSRD